MNDTLIAVLASQPQGGWYVGDFADEPIDQTEAPKRTPMTLVAHTTSGLSWNVSADNMRAWRAWVYGFKDAA